MMNTAQKKELVVKAIHALLRPETDDAGKYLADDATWWICKSLAGPLPKLSSKQKILERNSGAKNMFPEGLKTTIKNVFCDGDTVIVEFSNYGKTANGKIYDQDYCALFLLQGDKIKEIREHQDSLHVHQTFFS